MSIDETIEQMIDRKVEQRLEEKLPEIIRALGIRDTDETNARPDLADALEVAGVLNLDVSTAKKARTAKLYVYNLARQELIPSVRLSPRRIRFDLNKVKEVIAQGGNAQPWSKAS